MRRKVIYVDFVFEHKKVSYFKYYVLYLFSSVIKKLTLFINTKNKVLYDNEKRKMFK